MIALSNVVSSAYYTTEYMDWVMRELAYSDISHVEWQFSWEGNYQYSLYEIEQIVGFYEKYGLKAKGLHASDGGIRRKFAGMFKHEMDYDNRKNYLSFDELNRKAGVDLIKNHMDLAQAIHSGHNMVAYSTSPYSFLEKYGHRLVGIHLQDVHAPSCRMRERLSQLRKIR